MPDSGHPELCTEPRRKQQPGPANGGWEGDVGAAVAEVPQETIACSQHAHGAGEEV